MTGAVRFVTGGAVMATIVLTVASVAAQSGRPRPRPNPPPAQRVAELAVSDEVAMPGSIAQIKVFLTEPKPISTGLFDISDGFGDLAGVTVFSPDGDATGLAWSSGGRLRVVARSLASTFGTGDSDYPILTLAVRVPASVALGTVFPIDIAATSLDLRDPDGAPYEVVSRPGSITIGRAPVVEGVAPGSAVVEAGEIVTLTGHDFTAGMRVQIDEASVARLTVVSPSEITAVLAEPLDMHGREVKVRTRSSRTSYFSYQRTELVSPSAFFELGELEPAFATSGGRGGGVAFPFPAAGRLAVIAMQNVLLEPAVVQLSRFGTEGQASIELPPASRVVLEMSEIFGQPCESACTVLYSSTSRVQFMGLTTDRLLEDVRLLPAR